MFTSPFRALTFGEILDGAFTLYRRHFLTFFVSALVPYVPIGIVSGWFAASAPATPAAGPSLEYMGLMILLMFVSLLGFSVMWGALTRQSSQAYTGGEVSLGDGFRHGLRSFLSVIVVAVVGSFMIGMVMMIVIFVFAMIIGVMVAASAGGGGGGETLGIVFGVLAGVAVLVMMLGLGALLFAAVPAIVVERRGPFQAIGRSVSLAWGALPRVAGLLVVCYFIFVLPIAGGMIAIGLTQGFEALVTPGGLSPAALAVQQLISTVAYALTLPFVATALVLLYFDRRARTEAHDLEGMVRGLAVAG